MAGLSRFGSHVIRTEARGPSGPPIRRSDPGQRGIGMRVASV